MVIVCQKKGSEIFFYLFYNEHLTVPQDFFCDIFYNWSKNIRAQLINIPNQLFFQQINGWANIAKTVMSLKILIMICALQ